MFITKNEMETIVSSLPIEERRHLAVLFNHIVESIRTMRVTTDKENDGKKLRYLEEIEKGYLTTLYFVNSILTPTIQITEDVKDAEISETDIRVLVSAIKEYYFGILHHRQEEKHKATQLNSEGQCVCEDSLSRLKEEVTYNKYCLEAFLNHMPSKSTV